MSLSVGLARGPLMPWISGVFCDEMRRSEGREENEERERERREGERERKIVVEEGERKWWGEKRGIP